jgi:riboflavin biosynthesis pyrimidine reductase
MHPSAVVIRSGTLRANDEPWTGERAFPGAAPAFADARRTRQMPDAPALVVVTGSGALPQDHPSLPGAIIVTTPADARMTAERHVPCEEVVELRGDGDVDPAAMIAALRKREWKRITDGEWTPIDRVDARASVVDELS